MTPELWGYCHTCRRFVAGALPTGGPISIEGQRISVATMTCPDCGALAEPSHVMHNEGLTTICALVVQAIRGQAV